MGSCFKCKKYERVGKHFKCNGDIRELGMICLIRNMMWAQARAQLLQEQGYKKAQEFMDKARDDMNEGDEWKKGLDDV